MSDSLVQTNLPRLIAPYTVSSLEGSHEACVHLTFMVGHIISNTLYAYMSTSSLPTHDSSFSSKMSFRTRLYGLSHELYEPRSHPSSLGKLPIEDEPCRNSDGYSHLLRKGGFSFLLLNMRWLIFFVVGPLQLPLLCCTVLLLSSFETTPDTDRVHSYAKESLY
jgi:hypothetical protein